MDFLNKSLNQLGDLFRSMTAGARITFALLLVVVVVSLVYLFKIHGSGAEVDLMHGMPVAASQLPAMEAAFDKAGLSGYEIQGTQIRVPRGQEGKYMAAMADAKVLPPNFGSYLKEAINAGNAFESGKQHEQRVRIAYQETLASFISQMRGIESAYVLYDSDTSGGFMQEKVKTASVSVKPVGSQPLDETQVANIRYTVSAAFAGLKPESVTVTDLNGRAYHGDAENGGSADDNLYLALKRNYERDLKTKILSSLCYIPDVTVEPTVVLDPERFKRHKQVKHDPKPIPIHESETSTTRSQDGSAPAGRPGLQAQQPNASVSLTAARGGGGGSHEETDDSKRETYNITSGEEIDTETVGLTPKRVAVSVGVPSSYFEKVWRERNPAEAGKEAKIPDPSALDKIRQDVSVDIQKAVAALLPPTDGVSNLSDLVTVTTFQDIKAPPLPGPGTGEKALGWLGQYWGTLGIVALAVFSLVMLRSMVRSVPAGPEPKHMPAVYHEAGREEAEETDAAQSAAAKRLRRFQGSGRSLRDELSELVQEDPDVAANILKSWIGQAG